ncbi:Metabolite transport protein [Balamuthia mandrillaris]
MEEAQRRGESCMSLFNLASINIWGGFIFGYNTGIIALANKPIQTHFDLSTTLTGVVAASILMGAMVGSVAGGLLCDLLGRKKVMLLACAFTIAGASTSAFAPNLWSLCVLRVLLGVGVGLCSTVCPLYVNEMSPSEKRGRLGTLFQLSITLSIFVADGVGYAFLQLPSYDWRAMLGFGVLPGLILLGYALFAMPESRIWLSKHQNNYRPLEDATYDGDLEITINGETDRGGWRSLFAPRNWKNVIWGIMMAVALQLSGINAVIYYAPNIFESAGLTSDTASLLATLSVGGWNFVTTFLAVGLIDRFGRRPLFIIGGIIMGVADITLGFVTQYAPKPYDGYVSIACVLIFILGFEGGIGTLFWVLITEYYPSSVKSQASGFVNVLQWGLNLLLTLTFLDAIDSIGLATTFWIFGGVNILAVIYSWFCLPETKSRQD